MYSGGDSSGDGVNSHNPFNWQMTSQTSCNVNSGSIDWASLAQQWIQMKDSSAGLPEAPPPPIISSVNSVKSTKEPIIAKFDEQGEADMEVEKDDEEQMVNFDHNTPPPPPAGARWIPISNQHQEVESYYPPQQNWTWPARVALPPPILHVPITTGSLTPPIPRDVMSSTTPPLLQKPTMEIAAMLSGKSVNENVPMDAAKRKILPAWIREGLEKMEREKLKQLERGTKDKDPLSAGTAAVDQSDINNIKSMVKSSIMEMEGESSGNEDVNTTADPHDETDGETISALPANMSTNDDVSENMYNSGKTYEERIADMMIGVRKTLTELLLEVTNEEIVILANEAIRRRREKASSVQVIRKSAIPSITGKLGLEAYADSDSENSASDNDTTNDESKRSDDDYDSEEELKTNIRICQRAFLKTIEEIEDKIEASAVRDEYLVREHRKDEIHKKDAPATAAITDTPKISPVMQQKSKRFDKDIGEPLQPDKSKSNTNGKRRKERTSRFSDNKDSRNRSGVGTSFYQPPTAMGSGSLPSQSMPASLSALPVSNFPVGEFKSRTGAIAPSPPENEKRSGSSNTHKSSKQTSSAHNRHRRSDSSTSSTDSFSSSNTSSSRSRHSSHHRDRRYSRERSKQSNHKSSSHRSSSHRSSRRRDSSDSNDDDRYNSKRSSHHRRTHKSSHSSSKHSKRNNHRRRSDSRSSRSRTRSRSRSRSTTYSSSRR